MKEKSIIDTITIYFNYSRVLKNINFLNALGNQNTESTEKR